MAINLNSQILKVTGTLCIVFVLRGCPCQARPTSAEETFILPPRKCLDHTIQADSSPEKHNESVKRENINSMKALLISNLKRYKKKLTDVTEHTDWFKAMDSDWGVDVRVPVYNPLQKKNKVYEEIELYLQLAYRIQGLANKMNHVSHRRELSRSYDTIVGELESLQCAVESFIIEQNIQLDIPRRRILREEVKQINHNNLYINAKRSYHSLQNYLTAFKKDLKQQIY